MVVLNLSAQVKVNNSTPRTLAPVCATSLGSEEVTPFSNSEQLDQHIDPVNKYAHHSQGTT